MVLADARRARHPDTRKSTPRVLVVGLRCVFHGPSYNARATHKDAFLHGPCRHPLPYLPSNRMQARSFSVTHVDHHLQSITGQVSSWVSMVLPR
ncbi:hypothetical protein B296_00047898 [Ensete ventricosum]|uniref:Uncharacterized protein n=1 Tax=Ensete ventricosum TaxID=4639 RepID=A0A426WXA7_ENSVE|nr:hypothetical protein B296_00047898 [Ensete ventricosum]